MDELKPNDRFFPRIGCKVSVSVGSAIDLKLDSRQEDKIEMIKPEDKIKERKELIKQLVSSINKLR